MSTSSAQPPLRRSEQRQSRKQRRAARKQVPHPAEPGAMHLESVDRLFYAAQICDNPMVALLVSEDLCWQAGIAAWRERRPALWTRARWTDWRQEGQLLAAKRERLRELADQL